MTSYPLRTSTRIFGLLTFEVKTERLGWGYIFELVQV